MPSIIIGFAVILVIAIIIYVWKMNAGSDVAQSPQYTQQPLPQQPPQQTQQLPLIPSISPLPPMPSAQPTPQPMPSAQPTLQPTEQPVAAPPAITILPYTPPPIVTTVPVQPVAQPTQQPVQSPTIDPATLTKYIKVSKSSTIHKNDDDSFQLAELVINSADGQISPSDIASVTSSASAYGSNPKMIVDGNTNGSYFAMTSWHSDNVAQPRWIMVTLVKPMKISSVKVYNRTDCCWDRLSGATLNLLNADNKVIHSANLSGSLVQNYNF